MTLDLYTWGPAFDLPSIDAPCLATICYLRDCVPVTAWRLIPCSNPRVSPLRQLPALHDGDVWVAGFTNIVEHLRTRPAGGRYDLDTHLTLSARADGTAFAAFLEANGQPLLDLSLYVSSDNYLNGTRQALGDILPWPESWTVPHRLREDAKNRSKHLHLSSLDVDTAQEDTKDDSRLTAHIPKSLRKPRQTVSGLLGRHLQKNKFRLEAVTADFLEPLDEMLAGKSCLLGHQKSSLDCLAVGYLALMQLPRLPVAWLKDALDTKYSRLGNWVRDQAGAVLEPSVHVLSRLGGKPGAPAPMTGLPWQAADPRSFSHVAQVTLEGCVGSIPVIGSRYLVWEVPGNRPHPGGKQGQLIHLQRRRDVYLQVVASSGALAGLLAWMWYKWGSPIPSRHLRFTPNRRNFGSAGAVLGII